MAEYQSPISLLVTRLTNVILIESMIEVLFCLLEGFSLDGVEKAVDWEVDCILPVEESLDIFEDRAASSSSAWTMAWVAYSRFPSLYLLLLRWVLGGVE